jgi:hypothetical protein
MQFVTAALAVEPTEPAKTACTVGSPKNDKWAAINKYDTYFAQAAKEFGVDGNLLKAMAYIESGGQGHIDPSTGKPWVRYDGFVDSNGQQNPSIGLMQVKPGIWQSLVPNADAYDPQGNIRLGAAIMAKAIKDNGSWEKALTTVYFPADDPNGTTQQDYVDMVNALLTELGGSCGSSTNPDQTTPTNPNEAKSSCVVTKVGEPKVSPTLPPSCSGAGSGVPGQPFPEGSTQEVKDRLCSDYKVCVTRNTEESPASSDWTMDELHALWNVVQRIYESPTYTKLAIGNYELEMQRSACIPQAKDCSKWWGAYSGVTNPAWSTRPNSRLITISDAAAQNAQSIVILEWLFAHEIGHSASGGDLSGGLTPELGMNEAYKRVRDCGEIVSGYGSTDPNENNSEIIAFFMTAAEEATTDYLGSAKNLAQDFSCSYNATRQYYFDGKEF